MEQLRKRFDSGLDINELLATEEEQAEVCCNYNVFLIIVLPCQPDEVTT